MQRLEHHCIRKCSPSGKVERQDYFSLNFEGSVYYRLSFSSIHSYFEMRIALEMISPEKQLSNAIPFELGGETLISRDRIQFNKEKTYKITLENKLEKFVETYLFDGKLRILAKHRI